MENGLIIPFLDPGKNDIVLDLGCGTGRLAIPIAELSRKVIGIDSSEEMLEVARCKSKQLKNVEYKRAEILRRLPFDDASFDKVVAVLVVNHVNDLGKFFMEVHRVLKSGGAFVFDDAIPDARYFKQRFGNTLYGMHERGKKVFSIHTVDDYVNELHRGGFEIEDIKFTRFDERIEPLVTEKTFKANKGRTFGLIVRARKS